MENSVKERLKLFLKNNDIKGVEFCKSINVSSGFISGMRASIQPDKLKSIAIKYPHLNIGWLLTGEGEMGKINIEIITKPRIPMAASAGKLTEALQGVTMEQCEQIPVIRSLPTYDFTILVKGNSMEPTYYSGDEVACKRINEKSFIQWGKVHVLDTTQGVVIKRIYDAEKGIRCNSFNPEYPDFIVPKDEIYSMSLVVGLLRL